MNKDEYKKIYEDRLNSENSVKLDYTIKGYPAFYVVTKEVSELTCDILRLDKEALKLVNELPGVALNSYKKKSLIEEIVITNKIEGVHSTRKEVGDTLDILEKQSANKSKQHRFSGMVERYKKLDKNEPIAIETCEDIRHLYDEIVLEEVIKEDPENMPDGTLFRKELSHIIGENGSAIHVGKEPEAKIIEFMDKALKYLNDDNEEILYRACIFHYMLEDIHPFYDGNGRLGRFILSNTLSRDLQPIITCNLSVAIKDNINNYYKAFTISEDKLNCGDLTPFLISMLSIIKAAYKKVVDSLSESAYLLEENSKKIPKLYNGNDESVNNLYFILLQATLFSENGISTADLEKNMNITYVTLKKKLEIIDKRGMLITRKIGKKIYYALNMDKMHNA